ncbi:RICIN domain-containing protein [Streptomyces griseoruber]|uniref:Ricin B lectin domain-containing protein n=1 Tax=Streptomyces griseoruber TaxID=1943 RepID=A0A101SKF9_9ACTN|nr:RICIN domain-containing protein [Streptomyces griseoruber]KUN75561.1 hypothetical protein AQJ64_41940 [Streptomyces griseoruber]
MNHGRALAGAVAAAALAAAGLASTTAPADAADFLTIRNFGSNMCIQPNPADPTSTGVQLVQEPCDGSAAQQWSKVSLGSGNYQFVNRNTSGCMDAHGPNADRTPVDTWPCSSISNQKWNFAPTIPNALPAQLVSAIGGRCLDVAGGSWDAGAPIQIYHCTSDNSAQAWLIG